jgi:hypothetical protein
VTLSINGLCDTQHFKYYGESHYAECHVFHYDAESRYVECRYAECLYADCRGALFEELTELKVGKAF